MIRIEKGNLAEVMKSFDKQSAEMKEAIHISLKQAATEVQGKARIKAPIQTGSLRRSIQTDVRQTEAYVGSKLVYAPIQEFGGTITAKNSAYLCFRTKAGNWVKVRQVKIPPYKGVGYLNPALKEAQSKIIKFFISNINKAIA